MKLDFYQILSGIFKSCQDLETDLTILNTVEMILAFKFHYTKYFLWTPRELRQILKFIPSFNGDLYECINSSHPSANCSRHSNLLSLFPVPTILVTKYKGFLCNLFLLWE